jgi:hypothetical protein
MNISRKQLYALGEPFGESATRLKPGGRVYGGGGPSTPEKTTTVTDLPDWAKGYAKDTLAKTAAITDISKNPYQTYGGERIAGFQPMQQQSFESAQGLRPSDQLTMGTNLAGAAGLGALGANYQGRNFQGGQFDTQSAQQYMNPYTQNVVDYQKSQALRDFQVAQPMRQAQAVQQGAFGGSRSAIVDAEAQRSLNSQLQGIEATGQQAAFQNAQQQFNADQARRLQAQQMGEQSRQYGAGLGMQGLQTALQSAGQLGQLGQTQYGQETGIIGLQNQLGTQQQQQAQRPLDMAYQDFVNQQNYPYKQLGFMSDMIRGLPLGQQSTGQVYAGSGNTMGQLAGIGMGAYGLSKMAADGGLMDSYANGGLTYAEGGVTDPQNVESILSKLSDQQLQQAKEAALNRRDVNEAQMIDAEIAQRAAMRGANPQMPQGIAPAVTDQFANEMEQNMATGGIVAFADRGAVKEMPEKATSTIGDILDSIGVTGGLNALRENYYKSREGEKRIEDAESMYPSPTEALRPTERTRRTAAGDTLFKGPQNVKPMTPAEIEAANAEITKTKPSAAPAASTGAGAGRGSRQDFTPLEEVVKGPKPARSLEDVLAGPKPSKAAVKSAVEQFAEKQGLGGEAKDDVMANALKIREEFDKQNKPILDRLNAAIEAQKPNEQAIRDRGFNQALTQFGFGLAEKASKPGARFLESVSGAAPVIATVAAKTDEMLQTRKDNHAKLQLDQAKYEVALAKGDMQTAATLAGQIRQASQQDKLLQFQIAKAQDEMQMEKAKLAQQASNQGQLMSRYETVGSLTKDIMKNEGLSYDKALEKAGNILKGGIPAGMRGDTSTKIALAKEIDAIEKNYPAIMRSGDSKLAQENRRAYEAAINRVYSIYGGSAAENPAGRSALPSGVKVTEIGR